MEKNDPNQKFGLSADQLTKLAGLKKMLPEKKEEEVKAGEGKTEEEELSEALGSIIKKTEETGEELILEDIAAQFDKTPEEVEKIAEKLGYEKAAEEKPVAEVIESKPMNKEAGVKKNSVKPEKATAKTVRPDIIVIEPEKKETAPKPEYSEKYLLSTVEESRIIGDKKLEAYYKSKLDEYNKKKTAEAPVKKEERRTDEMKKSETVPAKNMPEFERFGPPTPAKKIEEKPAESSVEKPAYDPSKIGEVYGEEPKEGEGEKIAPVEKPSSEKNEGNAGNAEKEKPAKVSAKGTLSVPKGGSASGGKKEKLTPLEEEAKKIVKQVGKEGLFGEEAGEKADLTGSPREEEIPLGAEAAVRPMGGEKKKPLVERTEEEKKERATEFKKFQEMKKTRVAYADKAKDYYKYQTILGKFKKVFGGKEDAAKVTEEFEAARIKYEKAQAEFNGEKLIRHNVEERRRVDEIIGARAKENSTFEKFRAAYKWLGDQNLEKVIKPETKFGKWFCKVASIRTGIGLALAVSGFGLAFSGATAASVGYALFLRRIYSTAASGAGLYEGARAIGEHGLRLPFLGWEVMKSKTEFSGEEIKNLDLKSANEKMAQIESWAILNGKKIMEYPDYVKIRDRRTELLTGEKSVKLLETMAGQFAKMNIEIDKRNRGEMSRKAAALGVGIFVGSGGMVWGLKKLGIIGETPAPGARPEIIPKGADVIKESYIETAGKGSSVWKMTEHQLQARFGERFNGLTAAQKTYMIDYYKDMVVKNPKVFGLADIDIVKPGQKINFAPLFNDTANFEKGIGKALKLTVAETQNILSNNKLLREWVLSHPGERLTSAKVEELLRMPKGTMAEHFANDNMIVKPSGVTVAEVIAEQEKIRTAEIVGGMEERAVARILNNTIQESGLTFEEYRAIKGVSVKQLLEQAHWDNWKAGTVDLPHDGIYGGTEFARQLKLAEAIRSLNPSGGQLDMSVEDYLKGAIKEGKFSSRGAIESAAGSAVPEGSPAEIEARPRGIAAGVETEAKPKGAIAGVETAAESKPKVIEASAETKGAIRKFPSVELSTGERLEFVYNNEGNPVGFSELKAIDYEGGRELLNENWRESVREATKGMMNKQLYLTQVETQAAKIASWQKILGALPKDSQEASFLQNHIAKTIGNIEKRYGDVFK